MRRWAAAGAAVLAAGWKSPALAVVLALALLAGWVLFVLARPHRTCTWCGGTRRAKRYRWAGRTGRCRKCLARQVHLRPGAVMVHRMFWAVLGERRAAGNSTEGESDVQSGWTTVPRQRRQGDRQQRAAGQQGDGGENAAQL